MSTNYIVSPDVIVQWEGGELHLDNTETEEGVITDDAFLVMILNEFAAPKSVEDVIKDLLENGQEEDELKEAIEVLQNATLLVDASTVDFTPASEED